MEPDTGVVPPLRGDPGGVAVAVCATGAAICLAQSGRGRPPPLSGPGQLPMRIMNLAGFLAAMAVCTAARAEPIT